ncbi:MAG TPA: hypothetical protein PKV27_11945 [Ilumatobacteraceae bacterium]|nr:hypothetical protein [Ilumatobacteraceae bacterium]
MSYQHAIVWLDHREARVIDFSVDDAHTKAITNAVDARHVQHQHKDFHEFFEEITTSLGNAVEILVVGPATAKTDFVKFLKAKHPNKAKLVVGTEPLDHPTDGQLLAFARKYFKKYDQVH